MTTLQNKTAIVAAVQTKSGRASAISADLGTPNVAALLAAT
jgi:hypothetical protein